jgi:hypothetical protein
MGFFENFCLQPVVDPWVFSGMGRIELGCEHGFGGSSLTCPDIFKALPCSYLVFKV